MPNRHASLLGSNLSVLIYGRDLTVRQLQHILNADEVYKSLAGAKDDEVNKKFFKVFDQWKKYYEKQSYRKAKITKQILHEISSYSKNEKVFLNSFIDK